MQVDPSRQFRLDERVCFLSGATGHLGRFMAETLAAAGAHVLVNARNSEKVEELVGALRSSGWQASPAAFDVTDEAAIQNWVERTEREQRRLDVIVHNATSGRAGTFAEIQAADFEQVYKINVVAAFSTAQSRVAAFAKVGEIYRGRFRHKYFLDVWKCQSRSDDLREQRREQSAVIWSSESRNASAHAIRRMPSGRGPNPRELFEPGAISLAAISGKGPGVRQPVASESSHGAHRESERASRAASVFGVRRVVVRDWNQLAGRRRLDCVVIFA